MRKLKYLLTYSHCLLLKGYSRDIILLLYVSFSMELEKIAAGSSNLQCSHSTQSQETVSNYLSSLDTPAQLGSDGSPWTNPCSLGGIKCYDWLALSDALLRIGLPVPPELQGLKEKYCNRKRGLVKKKKIIDSFWKNEENIQGSERQKSKDRHRDWPSSIQRSQLRTPCLQRQGAWLPGKKKAKHITTLLGLRVSAIQKAGCRLDVHYRAES